MCWLWSSHWRVIGLWVSLSPSKKTLVQILALLLHTPSRGLPSLHQLEPVSLWAGFRSEAEHPLCWFWGYLLCQGGDANEMRIKSLMKAYKALCKSKSNIKAKYNLNLGQRVPLPEWERKRTKGSGALYLDNCADQKCYIDPVALWTLQPRNLAPLPDSLSTSLAHSVCLCVSLSLLTSTRGNFFAAAAW